MSLTKRLRVVVLLNASAGSVERQGDRRLRDVLATAFQKHGILAVLEVLQAAELRSAAERARQQVTRGELDAIVVGGGDGSVRTVASVLAGSGVPLGIIPLGTLNHFAKDLRVPLIADHAVAVIATGKDRYVDVGEVNGEIFVTTPRLEYIRTWFLNESGGGTDSGCRS